MPDGGKVREKKSLKKIEKGEVRHEEEKNLTRGKLRQEGEKQTQGASPKETGGKPGVAR